MKALQRTSLFLLLVLSLFLSVSWYLVRASKVSGQFVSLRAALTAAVSPAPVQATPPNATIIRTIVYRQLTDFQNGGSVGSIHNLKISANGAKIIFLSGRKVFTMDATGQNLREIYDAPNPATDTAPTWADISADGSKVIWAALSARTIFIANVDGTNRLPLAPTFQNRFGTNEVLNLPLSPRLTADGSRIIFMHVSSVEVSGGYRINADGTGLTRLFSYQQVSALFGRDGSEYNGNIAFRDALAISADGLRLVFGTYNFQAAGNAIVWDSVAGVRRLTDFLGLGDDGIALSSDGSKVTVIRRFPDRTSAIAVNFDGSNQIETARLYGDGTKLYGMSANGAQVLANLSPFEIALPLINTDGSGQLDLLALGDCDVDPWRGVGGGLSGSLAGDGRRFAFRTTPGGLPHQIWVADINPVSVGEAPLVSEVNFNPNYVTVDRTTSSTFTLRASGGTGGLRRRTCGTSLKDGAYRFRYVTGGASFGISLYDDATNGDPTANDGRYTQTQVRRDLSPPDPTNPLQIRANVIANSQRQITAIDATPFFVLSQVPGGAGPRLDSITPSSGAAGIQVKLTGSGFDPVPGNNIVLFGTRQAVVKTATADRTMLEVIVPPDLSPGVVAVTVTVAAQTSNAVNFTVTGSTGGVTLNDHRITGGPIPGACEPPVAKSSFAPTDAQAIQWTFVSGFQTGAVIRWEWVQPNGSIYLQHETPVNNPNTHVCFWNGINIAGHAAASLPGNWQVRVFYNGTLLATENFTITQAPACTYSISPTSQSFSANGGTGSVNVTTQPGCAWTATSNAGFVTISSGTPGTGSGTLNYSVAVNTSTAQRSGTITIAGQTFTVNQSGVTAGAPLIRIEPTTLSFNAARGQSLSLPNPRPPEPINIQRPKNEQEQRREDSGGDHAEERRDWFYRQRQYPFDQIPERARERAITEKVQAQARLQFAGTEAATEAVAAQWTHIGPSVTTSDAWGRVSGRVTSIIVHPTNPSIVYVSGAQGGVWRTTDNGATWMALTDDQPSLAMGALAFDPNNPSVIYAGTGEQNFSLDSYYGNDVLKSTNGGVTWSVLGTATFARQTISRIVVSPSNSQVVFAAANSGLFRSSDGGNTWSRVLAGIATDCIAQPGSGSVFYSAIHTGGVYKSTDGGTNWTKLTSGLPSANFRRIHLTISVAAPNTLLASFTANDSKLEGLYRSTDAGANWTKLVNTPNVFGGQGWYNVSLGLHPTNANVIYFGGLSLWRSLDGGTNWANVSNPRDFFQDVHPDQHAFAFNPQNPAVIWIGNDGGVWRSDNGGDTWLSRNDGLSLTQFQTVAQHPTSDALAFGGTQDNGIQKYTGNSEWRETRTGDNGSTFFDFNTPTTVYSTYILGSLIKSLSAGEPGTWAGATNGIPFSNGAADGRSAFYAPFTMAPTNPLQLAFGSYRVWYTTDGATNWNAISGDVTGGGVIMAITIAANGSRIWTGSSDAQVWRGDLSGGSWSFTSVTKAPLPNRAITRIAAHPSDPQTAYISFSGFGTEHVFKTTDGGATWTSANSGLPDIPVNAVLVDPNNPGTVYAGTDIGVYRSTEAGQNWMPFGTGLPNVAVFDLAIRKNSNVLRAATHGRGMWEIQATGEQSFTIFNDGDATLSVTGITKQNNAAWLSFTTPSNVPFDIPPKGSVPVRVAVNATGLAAGLYTERLLVTSNDAARSPYPTGVFINLNVTGDGNGGGCTFTLAPTNQSFAASGGTGSVNVTSPNGCNWTAKANDDWITITANASGSGNGTVNFSVAANPGAARGGTITIAGQTFAVTQTGGSNCTFTLAPTSQNFAASGGAGNVNVTSQSGCNWTATSDVDWITITSGANGTSSGVVNYLIASNNAAATRSGTLTIAGQTFVVTQTGGSNCAFTISPTSQTFSASGGNGSISVATQTNCNWTARTDDAWIVITSGASGSGSGTVSYRVAVNASPIPRAGFITVAGQTFIVGQAGTGATCGLTPINIGQTVNGALVNTDCRSPIYGANYYADLWYFTAKAGQQVAIQLNSTEFDAYLALIGPDGELLDEDDDGGGGLNARIPITSGFVTLPQDGTYIIEASSASENELGKYTLSLTAPGGCTFALAPSSQSIAASGGTGSVAVTSQTNCNWTAASNVDWITITSGASGGGNGAVNYSVAANTSTSSRTGTITIAGQTFTVTQTGGSNCTFTLAPTSQNIAAGGGTSSVNVTSQSGCNWTASSNADWLTISSGASGSGNGVVNYAVATNAGAARSGTLTIAGQSFTVTQAANSSCSYTLAPASQSFSSSGGSGNATVSTAAGCTWTASSNAAWISLQTGSESGTGNGSFGYSVALNPSSAARSGTITLGGQTITINQSGAGTSACVDVAISSALLASTGSTLTVPINVSDLTGKGALSFDATITFDPAVLRLQSTPIDRTGTLSSAMTVTVNTSTPGQIRISAFNSAALSGAGVLLNLKFDVIGTNGACSNLNWASFRFNEGTPCATTTNGHACVGSGGGSLSGTVSYCVSPKPVPGVMIAANGTPSASLTTGTNGVFQFTGLGSGAYTLTPSKTGDVNGITSFDAALVALHVVGASTLNTCQQVAGDASNNGAMSSFDAALIAQAVVGISNPSNFTGTWKFVPPARSYASLSGAQTGQNFDAVLVGDVSGNWSPGASSLLPSSRFSFLEALQTNVSLPAVNGIKGTTITIPINVGDLTGTNVIAYDFDLTFDPTLLQPATTPYDAAGTLSSAMTVTANATTGRLRLSAFGTAALSGSGTLLKLTFNVIGAGTTTALTWQKFALNEDTLPPASLTNGNVVVPPAATTVSAATYLGPELAAESIVSAFGVDLATGEMGATLPLPTTLAGTTVRVKDSAGVERLAPLFYVAPLQVNYLLPIGTAAGLATVTITNGAGKVSAGAVTIIPVAPGLFTANQDGAGAPAGFAIRVKPNGEQSREPLSRLDTTTGKQVPAPIDLGPEGEVIILELYGTGIRGRSSQAAVSATIGGVAAGIEYADRQPGFVGLDQVNIRVPRSLLGRGEVDLVLTVEGKAANTVKVSIR